MQALATAATGLFLAAVALAASDAAVGEGAARGGGWHGCCGATPWPAQGSGATDDRRARGMMGGSMARHRIAMRGGVPAPYAGLTNPAPRTRATVEQGERIYGEQCASCHGQTGHGDGPAAADLNPKPADLAWLSNLPLSRWDAFLFWTVSEGGAPVGSAMPSFKDSLSEAERWAVIGYIQAHLPQGQTRLNRP